MSLIGSWQTTNNIGRFCPLDVIFIDMKKEELRQLIREVLNEADPNWQAVSDLAKRHADMYSKNATPPGSVDRTEYMAFVSGFVEGFQLAKSGKKA